MNEFGWALLDGEEIWWGLDDVLGFLEQFGPMGYSHDSVGCSSWATAWTGDFIVVFYNWRNRPEWKVYQSEGFDLLRAARRRFSCKHTS